MNSDDINEISNDELDRVIREALAVDTDPRLVARLEHCWAVQSRRQLWRRRSLFVLPAAAAALVLIALLIDAKNGEDGAQKAEMIPKAAPVRDAVVPVEEALADDGEIGDDSHSAGRAPTEYERFVFIARTGKPATPTSLAAKIDEVIGRRGANRDEVLAAIEQIGGVEALVLAAGRTTEPRLRTAILGRLITFDSEEALIGYLSLVRDDATRPAALAAADATPGLPVARLLTLLDHDDKSVRLSAAMVLGHVNGPEVTQSLIVRVTEKPSQAREAWLALMACRGQMAEEFLAYASRRPQLLGHLNSARVQWAHVIH